jgi:hypothetical protein
MVASVAVESDSEVDVAEDEQAVRIMELTIKL